MDVWSYAAPWRQGVANLGCSALCAIVYVHLLCWVGPCRYGMKEMKGTNYFQDGCRKGKFRKGAHMPCMLDEHARDSLCCSNMARFLSLFFFFTLPFSVQGVHQRMFELILLGRGLAGLGAGGVTVSQQKMAALWFGSSRPALLFIQIATRIGPVLNFFLTAGIASRFGFRNTLWMGKRGLNQEEGGGEREREKWEEEGLQETR